MHQYFQATPCVCILDQLDARCVQRIGFVCSFDGCCAPLIGLLLTQFTRLAITGLAKSTSLAHTGTASSKAVGVSAVLVFVNTMSSLALRAPPPSLASRTRLVGPESLLMSPGAPRLAARTGCELRGRRKTSLVAPFRRTDHLSALGMPICGRTIPSSPRLARGRERFWPQHVAPPPCDSCLQRGFFFPPVQSDPEPRVQTVRRPCHHATGPRF